MSAEPEPTRRTESWYIDKLNSCGVPKRMHGGYIRYLLDGILPGHFLRAVLSNDLKEACGRGDEENQRLLARHVFFLYNHCPGNSWGSLEAVERWIDAHAPKEKETA